jgi:hypothetical protein
MTAPSFQKSFVSMYPALNQTGAGHVAYGVSTMDVENANSSGDRTCSAFSQFRRPIFRPNAQRQKHPGSVRKGHFRDVRYRIEHGQEDGCDRIVHKLFSERKYVAVSC